MVRVAISPKRSLPLAAVVLSMCAMCEDKDMGLDASS